MEGHTVSYASLDQASDASSFDGPYGPCILVDSPASSIGGLPEEDPFQDPKPCEAIRSAKPHDPCSTLDDSEVSKSCLSKFPINTEFKERKLSNAPQSWDQECRQIFIKGITPTTIVLQVQSNWDGLAIKAAIQEKTGHYPSGLMLTWGGRHLFNMNHGFSTNGNQLLLSSFNIPHNATLIANNRSAYQIQLEIRVYIYEHYWANRETPIKVEAYLGSYDLSVRDLLAWLEQKGHGSVRRSQLYFRGTKLDLNWCFDYQQYASFEKMSFEMIL
ncbi:hypothetical protein BGZ60DRAFT_401887 [Tricladium varicosporioides]|nr:hypothetical protein BGZ60DRAFT_401887 [Hymenoscyphus varicosporioides]